MEPTTDTQLKGQLQSCSKSPFCPILFPYPSNLPRFSWDLCLKLNRHEHLGQIEMFSSL